MDDYSNKSAAQHPNAQIFLATWQASQARTKAKAAHLRQIVSEAHQRQADDRRREQTRIRVARHRAARKPTWEPHPVDRDRLKAEAKALAEWLAQGGRRQGQLRPRAKEIMTSRALYAQHVARTGEILGHREMAEAMSARTGEAWNTRRGQSALEVIRTLEGLKVWERMTLRTDAVPLPAEIVQALETLTP